MEKQIGQTKSVGFQFGLRKTFPVTAEKIWDFLLSPPGLQIWLGKLRNGFEVKQPYATEEDIEGTVLVFKPFSHMRLQWKRKQWSNVSTLQLRVIDKQERATISFHQEKLQDTTQREDMKTHWNAVMDQISRELPE